MVVPFILRRVYISKCTEPVYNLAAESYLLNSCKAEDEILFLWQNEHTVVIGRNQNPWKECAVEAFLKSDGKIVRRQSGGGAVYHDLGNLNFTFISSMSDKRIEDNSEFIIRVLKLYGIDAVFTGKNDIVVGDKKVSGCAYYEENDMICHHGTLLVNCRLDNLERALKPSMLKLKSKGIDSIRSRVLNLKELNDLISVSGLVNDISLNYVGTKEIQDIQSIYSESHPEIKSRMDVYQSWAWCFGESPIFSEQFTERFPWGEIDFLLDVQNGRVHSCKVYTDALDVALPERFEKEMIGLKYENAKNKIAEMLSLV